MSHWEYAYNVIMFYVQETIRYYSNTYFNTQGVGVIVNRKTCVFLIFDNKKKYRTTKIGFDPQFVSNT